MASQNVKFRNLCETLKGKILSGQYNSTRPLPSVRALMERFGLSSSTVRRAFAELERMGLVVCNRGSGTFVTPTALSRKIGIMVPGVAYAELFPPVVGAISRLAEAEDYTVVLADLGIRHPEKMAARAKRFAKKLVAEGVSGVIYQPLELIADSEKLNQEIVSVFDAANVAVVLFDYDIVSPPKRSNYDIVGINNFDAGFCLGDHLMSAGAKKVSFFLRPNSAISQVNRVRGGIFAVEAKKGNARTLIAQPDDSEAIRRHLRGGRPDAIICGDDRYAARLMQTLAKLGLRVPGDILLAGFDDVQIASLTMPGLTTIHQPCEDLAKALFRMLLDRIADRTRPANEIYLPAPLVERGSTCRAPKGKVSRERVAADKTALKGEIRL